MKKSLKKISCLVSIALLSSVTANFVVSAKTVEVSNDSDVKVEKAGDNGLCDYYQTNPNGQVGKEKTITSIDDFTADMLIAQSAVNDDARAYRATEYGGSMHEKPVDTYQLYGAWDDNNIYLMWIMTNVTDVEAPDQNYPISDNGKPWNGDLCQMILMNVDPSRGGSGVTNTTDPKTGAAIKGSNLWGVRVNFETKVDKVAMIHSNSTGEQGIFSLNDDDEFDYDTAVKITNGKTATEGTHFTWVDGLPSCVKNLWGMKGWASQRKPGDMVDGSAEWVDFLTTNHDKMQDTTYLMTIPLSDLGITKADITSKGVGFMHVTTFGLSGMDSCPYDISMNDAAADACPQDPSTSGEKEDIDTITAPLASLGKLRDASSGSTVKPIPSISTDVKGEQPTGKKITFTTSVANGTAPFTYQYYVDGEKVGEETDSETFEWTPEKEGDYTIKVLVKDSAGNKGQKEKKMTIVGPSSGDTSDDSDKDDDKPSGGDTTDTDNNKDNDQDSKGDDSDVKEEPLKAGKITISGSKNVGDEITLTSSATGGDENYKYKYTITDKNDDVVSSRAYAKDPKYVWTPDEDGEYTVLVNIKDGNGNTDEVTSKITISKNSDDSDNEPGQDTDDKNDDNKKDENNKPNEDTDGSEEMEELQITSIKAAKITGIEVNEKVKITVKATGGSGSYKYKIVEDGKEIGSFTSASNLYYTPKNEGTHTIKVIVSDDENDTIAYSTDKLTLKVTAANQDDDFNQDDDSNSSKDDSTNSGDSRSIMALFATAAISCFTILRKKIK